MAVVGGSSLIAAAGLVKRSDGWQPATTWPEPSWCSGSSEEVASIRGFHFLQVIYLVTGALVVTWTPGHQQKRDFIQ